MPVLEVHPGFPTPPPGETDLPEKVTHRKHQTVTRVWEGHRAKGSWRNKDFLKDTIKNWADRRLKEDIYNL